MVRRLIETDEMPIRVISAHARKDQNIRKGHLHSMHVWWATRPLAACRATLMATLLPDPVDPQCPETFRQIAREELQRFSGQGKNLTDPMLLRKALLSFIAHFADWENAHKTLFIDVARKLVKAAHPDEVPLVVDPFSGMGSIPFEALRIGAEAFAGDLNPVAVLLNKVSLEYLPRYGLDLANAVRNWGNWIREQAIEELRPFYPLEPNGAEPLAYIWARTIYCEGPGCGIEVPMVGLLWLSRKEKQPVALRYIADKDAREIRFEIFAPRSENDLQPPIVRKRFSVTCPMCGYTMPYDRVREQIRAKQGGSRDARLIAVITLQPDGSREFRLATEQDIQAVKKSLEEISRREMQTTERLTQVPEEPLPPEGTLGFRINLWGMKTWGDLFTPRQALALTTFVRLVREAHENILSETSNPDFARAVTSCLAVAVSRSATYLASTSFFHPTFGMQQIFLGSSIPMKPDFAETNPLIPKLVGGFAYALDQVLEVLEREGSLRFHTGTTHRGSATSLPLPDATTPYVITDPPYYDAVPYAALSDFCYVWLKRMLYDIHPDLFNFKLTPKAEECIMDPGSPPPGEPEKTKEFFEHTMKRALEESRRVLRPDGLAVVLFAHKGTAGWEAMLNALVGAGWMVTSSWPIETERSNRKRAVGSAALESSVFLVCRPRSPDAGIGEWRVVLREMNERVAKWLRRLEEEGIHGADAIFACIGPALEVYSRYEQVETVSGEIIPLGNRNGNRGYLSYVWEAVAREALRMIFPQADPQGFEEDARVTALWLWTLLAKTNGEQAIAEEVEGETGEATSGKPTGGWALPYDDARLIIQALGADEAKLKRPGGIIEVQGNSARLLPVVERRRFLLASLKESPPSRYHEIQPSLFDEIGWQENDMATFEDGQTLLDRLHQAMLLFGESRMEALRYFLVDKGHGRDTRFWRLADALSRLYPPASREKRLVDGLITRRKGLGI